MAAKGLDVAIQICYFQDRKDGAKVSSPLKRAGPCRKVRASLMNCVMRPALFFLEART